ncbi:hypothetical protein MRB53_040588 [Persea americana]|nr:hypothetical protein MRB53_040588 [Persea americana]
MQRRRGDLFVSNPDVASYYNASTKALDKNKLKFRRAKDHFSMFTEGFVLDVIETAHATSNGGEIPEPWLKLRQEYKDSPGDGTSEDYETKFSRTVTADRQIDRNSQPAHYQSTLKAILDMHQEGGSISVLKPDIEARIASKHVREVLEHVENTVFNRRLIQTKTYKLLGLAPAETREDKPKRQQYRVPFRPIELLRSKAKDMLDIILEHSRWPRLAILLGTILVFLFVDENLLLAMVLSLLTSLHIFSGMLRRFVYSSNALVAMISMFTVPGMNMSHRWTLLQAVLTVSALFLGIPALIPDLIRMTCVDDSASTIARTIKMPAQQAVDDANAKRTAARETVNILHEISTLLVRPPHHHLRSQADSFIGHWPVARSTELLCLVD